MLHEAVRRVGETRLLLAFGIEEDQVPGDILHLRLGTFLHLFPSACAELAQLRRLAAFFPLYFDNFMQGMDADEYNIVILINQFDGLFCILPFTSVRTQSPNCPYAMVDMYDIIPLRELVQLLERKGDLSASCLIALQVELVGSGRTIDGR